MSVPFLESELCAAYAEEARCYAQAVATAELLSPALQEGRSADDLLDRIVGLLGQVNGIEARIAETKRCWHDSAQKPGRDLNEVLLRVEQSIQELRVRLAEAGNEAGRQKTRLTPQLDGLIRGAQMRRAYGGTAYGGTAYGGTP